MSPLWTPSTDRIARANITRFMHFVHERHQAPVHEYTSLHRWSIEYPENFWSALWDFCEVRASSRATQILEDGNRLPGAQWFIGARLNYAENILRRDDDECALVCLNDREERRTLSFRALRSEVARIGDGLRRAGVKKGDRVCAVVPNAPEAVIAMLATASVGAIWCAHPRNSSPEALREFLKQVGPKVVFATQQCRMSSKASGDTKPLSSAGEKMSGIQKIVLVPQSAAETVQPQGTHCVSFAEFGSKGAAPEYKQLAFDEPAFITHAYNEEEVPCFIVHSAGGVLMQQLKEFTLQMDIGPSDRMFCLTSCGEPIWNALVSGLATGASLVLYEGAAESQPTLAWRIVAQESVTVFGVTAAFLQDCEKAALHPGSDTPLPALRTIVATDPTLGASSYRYVYEHVKSDVLLAAQYGHSDIMACFAAGCPVLPVHEGEIQCAALGMKVEVHDDANRPVVNRQGELVCTAPFPSVPLGFWGDTAGLRFRETYFARYPNIWQEGLIATLTPRGSFIAHGRMPRAVARKQTSAPKTSRR